MGSSMRAAAERAAAEALWGGGGAADANAFDASGMNIGAAVFVPGGPGSGPPQNGMHQQGGVPQGGPPHPGMQQQQGYPQQQHQGMPPRGMPQACRPPSNLGPKITKSFSTRTRTPDA